MLISQVMKLTGLTKKAIIYYTEQGFVNPVVSGNGYREYREEDLLQFQRIKVLRKLEIGLDEIKTILDDQEKLQKLSQKRYLSIERRHLEVKILERLSESNDYDQAFQDLKGLEYHQTITEKLLDAFPGYYGRFVCMHFAHFLNEPITNELQVKAYEVIISFLDQLPLLEISDDLQEYINEHTRHMQISKIQEMLENTHHSMNNFEQFLAENECVLNEYLVYRQSEEYRNSPNFELKQVLTRFHQSTGYHDIFLPAMKQLSPTYLKYCEQMEEANEKLLSRFPDIADLD